MPNAAKARKHTKPAGPAKVPKTVALPWANGSGLVASADGTVVIAAGEGAIGRANLETWQFEPWPNVNGFVNHMEVSPDGSRVAVGATGDASPLIEIRDTTSGKVVARIITKRNPRVSWSPSGKLLAVRLEADVDHEHEDLAIVDVAKRKLQKVKVGKVDSVAACWIDDSTVLAFVRRPDAEDARDMYRVLRIDSAGKVVEVGPSACMDSYRSLTRVGANRFLLAPYNDAWCLVDSTGKLVSQGARFNAVTAGSEGIASAHGTGVTRFSMVGKKTKASKAKKRVESLCFGGGKLLLLQSGPQGQLEVV